MKSDENGNMYIALDSYDKFIKNFKIRESDLIEFGIMESIYPDEHKVREYWDKLKDRIRNGMNPIYIRGYGRDAKGTEMFIKFYASVINNKMVCKDPNNNAKPTALIRDLTNYTKATPSKTSQYKKIQNYQISHIFGKTKNIYTFTAPWNIVYMPKMLDPFTGHEAKGSLKEEFQFKFQEHCYKKYRTYIGEYNDIVTDPIFEANKKIYLDTLDDNDKSIQKFKEIIEDEFSPITEENLGTY